MESLFKNCVEFAQEGYPHVFTKRLYFVYLHSVGTKLLQKNGEINHTAKVLCICEPRKCGQEVHFSGRLFSHFLLCLLVNFTRSIAATYQMIYFDATQLKSTSGTGRAWCGMRFSATSFDFLHKFTRTAREEWLEQIRFSPSLPLFRLVQSRMYSEEEEEEEEEKMGA